MPRSRRVIPDIRSNLAPGQKAPSLRDVLAVAKPHISPGQTISDISKGVREYQQEREELRDDRQAAVEASRAKYDKAIAELRAERDVEAELIRAKYKERIHELTEQIQVLEGRYRTDPYRDLKT